MNVTIKFNESLNTVINTNNADINQSEIEKLASYIKAAKEMYNICSEDVQDIYTKSNGKVSKVVEAMKAAYGQCICMYENYNEIVGEITTFEIDIKVAKINGIITYYGIMINPNVAIEDPNDEYTFYIVNTANNTIEFEVFS